MCKIVFAVISLVILSGCSTFTPPEYLSEYDNVVELQKIKVADINVTDFSGPREFESACRAVGQMAAPDDASFAVYIQGALAEELKLAGLYDKDQSPRISLSGKINSLNFSSTRAMYGGSWEIDLTLNSSNGESMSLTEHFEFEGSFNPKIACNRTADAFVNLVQNLIGNIVYSSEFRKLLI